MIDKIVIMPPRSGSEAPVSRLKGVREQRAGCCTLRLRGTLDHRNVESVRALIRQLGITARGPMIVDLHQVTRIDLEALTALLSLSLELYDEGVEIHLRCRPAVAHRLFDLSGIFDDVL